VEHSLPGYARPLFVRLLQAIETTGTFKMKKTDLQKEGFDPGKVTDPVYVLDPGAGEYRELTKSMYDDIVAGKMRL
jgi:hypothetical protein